MTQPVLTGFEQRLLSAIASFVATHHQAPTVAELARELKVNSRGSVHRYLTSLIDKGCLDSEGRGWRNIRLTAAGQQAAELAAKATARPSTNAPTTSSTVSAQTSQDSQYLPESLVQQYKIPLLGKIAAGHPIEAMSNEDTLDLAGFFIGPDRYALRVTGDSMIEAGILDGDTVIVKKQSIARTGDIVVALIDRMEATLKRLGPARDGSVELIPENDTMAPMRYATSRVDIQGIVVGQMRSY